jgi:hypothetical protein
MPTLQEEKSVMDQVAADEQTSGRLTAAIQQMFSKEERETMEEGARLAVARKCLVSPDTFRH